jgi:hypothetical protein
MATEPKVVTNQPTHVSEPGPTRVADVSTAKKPATGPKRDADGRLIVHGDPQAVSFDMDPEVKKQLDIAGSYKPPKEKIEAENQRIKDEEQTFRVNAEHALAKK